MYVRTASTVSCDMPSYSMQPIAKVCKPYYADDSPVGLSANKQFMDCMFTITFADIKVYCRFWAVLPAAPDVEAWLASGLPLPRLALAAAAVESASLLRRLAL